MNADELFHAYRCLLASPRDERVFWWYFGTTLVSVPGLPPLPTLNAVTLMVYRSETLSADSFAIYWDEVGCFTDYTTGEPAPSWLNPVTGQLVEAPLSFAEGPARYQISRSETGVSVELSQPGASVRSIEVAWLREAEQLRFVQSERKVRGFPEADGQLPDPASKSGFEAVTQLIFMDRWPSDGRRTRGLYQFAMAGAPPWMGFDARGARATVNGVIVKATEGASPRPGCRAALLRLFPDFFARHGA